MSAIELSVLLNKLGVIFKMDKTRVLYAKFMKKGYTKTMTQIIESDTKDVITNIETVWTAKGREFIHKRIGSYNQ